VAKLGHAPLPRERGDQSGTAPPRRIAPEQRSGCVPVMSSSPTPRRRPGHRVSTLFQSMRSRSGASRGGAPPGPAHRFRDQVDGTGVVISSRHTQGQPDRPVGPRRRTCPAGPATRARQGEPAPRCQRYRPHRPDYPWKETTARGTGARRDRRHHHTHPRKRRSTRHEPTYQETPYPGEKSRLVSSSLPVRIRWRS
jgi:hypothetical protein